MKACPSSEQLASLLADELSEADGTALETHVESCGQCQNALAHLSEEAADGDLTARSVAESAPDAGTLEFLERVKKQRLHAEEAMATPSANGPGDATLSANAPLPSVAGYEILAELGRGGMGVVYQARHLGLNRLVALKMLLAAPFASDDSRRRFRREAQAIARLQHANIVQVYDVGETAAGPYFSLELVESGSLAKHLNGTPWNPRAAAGFLEPLAGAIHYAHAQGVIHRDLKPANILLKDAKYPESCLLHPAPFSPKITDFGLAKCVEDENGQTPNGAVLGTPSYLAPEQVVGTSERVGPATDVYGLGAILYELLTGGAPFRGDSVMSTLLQVTHQEPTAPTRLGIKLPRDLETICLKCLQKSPKKRYASAELLAEDLHRFLVGEPIRARPPGLCARAVKAAKRRPLVAALSAAVVLSVAVGFALVLWQLRIAEDALGDARRQKGIADGALVDAKGQKLAAEAQQQKTATALAGAEYHLYLHRIALADREWWAGRVTEAAALLDQCPPENRHWEWHYLKRRCRTSLLTLEGNFGTLLSAQYTANGQTLIGFALAGPMVAWDAQTGKELFRVGPAQHHRSGAASPDGRHVATVMGLHDIVVRGGRTGKELFTLNSPAHVVTGLAFSPDGRYLASVGVDRTVKIWDLNTRQVTRTLLMRTTGSGLLVWDRDGRRLAAAEQGLTTVQVWDAETGRDVLRWGGLQYITALAFQPGGDRLIVTGHLRGLPVIQVLDLAGGRGPSVWPGHRNGTAFVSWSPDGRWAVTGGRDGLLKVWEPLKAGLVNTLAAHAGAVQCGAFSPDGRRLVSGGLDHMVRVWDAARWDELVCLRGHSGAVVSVAYSPDGSRVASAAADGRARSWDPTTPQDCVRLHTPQGAPLALVSPDGTRLAQMGPDYRSLTLRETATGKEVRRSWQGVGGHPGLLVFSHDSRLLATAHADGAVRIWEASGGRLLHELRVQKGIVNRLTFRPDGRQLAYATPEAAVSVRDVETGKEVGAFRGHSVPVSCMAFTPDGRRIASAELLGPVRLWEVASGKELRVWRPHHTNVFALAFHPRGGLLAAGTAARKVLLWDVATGEEYAALGGHAGAVLGVAFSPDGGRLAVVAGEPGLKLWDVATRQEVLALRCHPRLAESVAFSQGGRRLTASNRLGDTYLWSAEPWER